MTAAATRYPVAWSSAWTGSAPGRQAASLSRVSGRPSRWAMPLAAMTERVEGRDDVAAVDGDHARPAPPLRQRPRGPGSGQD
ncbi:MAG: hypothetical protein ACYC3U_08940 [Georgenia sp.]